MLRCQHKLSLQAKYFKFLLAASHTLVARQATTGSHCLFGETSSVAVSFISIELCSRLLNARVIMVKKIHTIQ